MIANGFGCATHITITLVAVREGIVTILTLVALPVDDVFFAVTVTCEQVALRIVVNNAVWRAVTFVTSYLRCISICAGLALVAALTSHVLRAMTLSGLWVAVGRTWAITFPAIRKAVVVRLTNITSATDNVWFTRTLAAKLLALKAHRTLDITAAGQRAVVIIACDGKDRVAAEALFGRVNEEMVGTAFFNKFIGLIELKLFEVVVGVLVGWNHEDVVQPDTFTGVLF